MISIRTNFASPSSFLTTHHSQPGDERDASGTDVAPRDATSYRVATLPFEPPDAAAPATRQLSWK